MMDFGINWQLAVYLELLRFATGGDLEYMVSHIEEQWERQRRNEKITADELQRCEEVLFFT